MCAIDGCFFRKEAVASIGAIPTEIEADSVVDEGLVGVENSGADSAGEHTLHKPSRVSFLVGLVELKTLQGGIGCSDVKRAVLGAFEVILCYDDGVEGAVFGFVISQTIARRGCHGGGWECKKNDTEEVDPGAKTKHSAKVQHKSERKEGKCEGTRKFVSIKF